MHLLSSPGAPPLTQLASQVLLGGEEKLELVYVPRAAMRRQRGVVVGGMRRANVASRRMTGLTELGVPWSAPVSQVTCHFLAMSRSIWAHPCARVNPNLTELYRKPGKPTIRFPPDKRLEGYLAHQKQHPPLGPP